MRQIAVDDSDVVRPDGRPLTSRRNRDPKRPAEPRAQPEPDRSSVVQGDMSRDPGKPALEEHGQKRRGLG
jgi:hypothetical protein